MPSLRTDAKLISQATLELSQFCHMTLQDLEQSVGELREAVARHIDRCVDEVKLVAGERQLEAPNCIGMEGKGLRVWDGGKGMKRWGVAKRGRLMRGKGGTPQWVIQKQVQPPEA